MTIPESFQCEYCLEPIAYTISQPVCRACGTRYRYDAKKSGYVMKLSSPQVFGIISLILISLGLAELIWGNVPLAFCWFFLFAGFGMDYLNGLHSGVLGSRFFVLHDWELTVYRARSPLAFSIAKIIEGVWVLGLFVAFLFAM